MPAGRHVSPEQQSYETVHTLPERPQHFPVSDVESRSQNLPTPQEEQTEPRSPQAMSVWEAGGTQRPVCVQHPRQLVVLHFDWQLP